MPYSQSMSLNPNQSGPNSKLPSNTNINMVIEGQILATNLTSIQHPDLETLNEDHKRRSASQALKDLYLDAKVGSQQDDSSVTQYMQMNNMKYIQIGGVDNNEEQKDTRTNS